MDVLCNVERVEEKLGYLPFGDSIEANWNGSRWVTKLEIQAIIVQTEDIGERVEVATLVPGVVVLDWVRRRGRSLLHQSAAAGHMPFCFNHQLRVTQTCYFLGANILRYFVWLDEYVASLYEGEIGNTAEVIDPMKRMEERMTSLEKMMMKMESGTMEVNKDGKGTNMRGILLFLLGFAFAYCWAVLFKSLK
ncbi:hypothetical protein PIB30_071180 [Stylosanthes scabra]|uniref:Uncharacterized protein n=1 Tax=Stylosanthes scabra TaxID=79078 RepID=A0ABU6TND2_9FABA|nr:hypothetical protein [Stylosanthes scabra]